MTVKPNKRVPNNSKDEEMEERVGKDISNFETFNKKARRRKGGAKYFFCPHVIDLVKSEEDKGAELINLSYYGIH